MHAALTTLGQYAIREQLELDINTAELIRAHSSSNLGPEGIIDFKFPEFVSFP